MRWQTRWHYEIWMHSALFDFDNLSTTLHRYIVDVMTVNIGTAYNLVHSPGPRWRGWSLTPGLRRYSPEVGAESTGDTRSLASGYWSSTRTTRVSGLAPTSGCNSTDWIRSSRGSGAWLHHSDLLSGLETVQMCSVSRPPRSLHRILHLYMN